MWRLDKGQSYDKLERKWFSLAGHDFNQFKSYEEMDPEIVTKLEDIEINDQL